MVGKNIVPASKSTTIWPINFAAELVPAEAKIAANFGKGVWSGLTGGKAGEPAIPVAPVSTPAATQDTAVTPGLGPRAPVAPPVAVDPSVSGAGITANPMGITPLRTAPVTPVAPVATALPADDFGGADDVLPVAPAAAQPAAPVAEQPAAPTRIQPRGQFAPNDGMQSDAARRMAVGFMANSEQVRQNLQGGPVRRIDPNSIQGQQLRSRWEEAAQKAMEGAMSPQQWTRYKEEQEKRRMENVADYNATPAAIEAGAARKRDVDVAQAAGGAVKAKNDIAAEGMKQEAELKREELALRAKGDEASLAQADRLAARSEELRKTLSTDDRKDKLADREEARKMKQYEVIGNQITRLLTSNNADPEVIKDKVAELEKQQARIMGFDTESAPTGKQPTAAERAKAALRGTPSLSSPAFQDGAMMTKGGKTYKRTNGVWVAQ